MKATKLPSGKWRARAYNKYTGSTKSFTAETKKEAERLAAAYEFREGKSDSVTLETACINYIEGRRNVLSPNTIKDYNITTKCHLGHLRNRRLSNITDIAMQEWINNLSETLSPKSVKNCYGFVNAAITAQMPSRRFSVALPKKVRRDIKMPSEADIGRIMEAVEGTDLDIPVKLAVFCCMRRGEIAALLNHPECIGKDSVTVRYNMVKSGNEWIEKAPKTFTSYRTIPCPEWLAEEIKGAEKVNSGTITDHWIKLMKKMGLQYRFHDLRHFSASAMLTVMPTVDVEKFGGWRHGSAVLQDIYTYNIDESLRKSADAWQKKTKEFSKGGHYENQ